MSEPFLGQIEAFPFGFVPKGWHLCDGSVLAINQFQALFSLLGTTYGGNGTSNFALPDLRGRAGMGQGTGPALPVANLGQASGEESHVLTASEIPGHGHTVHAVTNGTAGGTSVPGPSVGLGSARGTGTGNPAVPIYSSALAPTGAMLPSGTAGARGHENRMPFLSVNYCIAMQGIFPSHN